MSDEVLPADDLHGPYHATVLIGTPGREDCFVSMVDADTLSRHGRNPRQLHAAAAGVGDGVGVTRLAPEEDR